MRKEVDRRRSIASNLDKNAANIRQQYKTPNSRKQHRQNYVDFLDESKYYPDVFQIMINKIQTLINDTVPEIDWVLERGHFYLILRR